MPKVQLLVNVGYDGVMNVAGATLEVPKEVAADWRKRRIAVPLGGGAQPLPPDPVIATGAPAAPAKDVPAVEGGLTSGVE